MVSPEPQEKTPKHFGEIISNPGTPSDLLDGSTVGLHIPVSSDSGFYGYNDEKHLQHVSIPNLTLHLRLKTESSTQMGEKIFAQRRASTNSDGGRVAFKSGLTMTSVTSVIEPNILSLEPSPFTKEDELKDAVDAGPSVHPVPGESFCVVSHQREPLNSSDAHPFSQEFLHIFQSLEKCLSLRDKYMQVSLQRLGDNPRDHDGHFHGLDSKITDVSGVRPDADISAYTSPDSEVKLPRSPFKPWRIYPRPPPPHWHWTDDTEPVHGDETEAGKEEFVFEKCEIPRSHNGWDFELDETGVYQVYNASGSSIIFYFFL